MPNQQLTDAEITELAPLANVIAETLRTTPVRLGDPADLIGTLTLRVAAYMGGIVPGPDEHAQHRDQVLTEAAALLQSHRGDLNAETPWWDTRDRDTAAALLLAARTAPDAP